MFICMQSRVCRKSWLTWGRRCVGDSDDDDDGDDGDDGDDVYVMVDDGVVLMMVMVENARVCGDGRKCSSDDGW